MYSSMNSCIEKKLLHIVTNVFASQRKRRQHRTKEIFLPWNGGSHYVGALGIRIMFADLVNLSCTL